MKIFKRAMVAVSVIFLFVMGLKTLQYYFDQQDLNRASQVIYEYNPLNSSKNTLVEFMAADLGLEADKIFCEAQILSRYEGKVLVQCGFKPSFEKKVDDNRFEWIVNIVAQAIHPNNDKAKELIKNLNKINKINKIHAFQNAWI